MLQFLKIENLALIDRVEMEFAPGFITVTGETGAGKSILLGALRLLSGGRVDKSVIRSGAERCALEAELFFTDPAPVDALLESCGLPPCEEGRLLLKRIIPREKAPRIMVNESLTTLGQLQKIGEYWIDFHGPDDPQRLFAAETQRGLLDLYAGHEDGVEAFRQKVRQWQNLREERESLANEKGLSPEEQEYLRDQLLKFETLELTPEGIETLESHYQKVSNARELMECAGRLSNGMQGEGGVADQLAEVYRIGQEMVELDPAQESLVERLKSLMIECQDLGRDVAGLENDFDFSSGELEEAQEKMNTWMELRRQYGRTLEEVLTRREEMTTRLERQSDIKASLAKLDKDIQAEEKVLRKDGEKLTAQRQKAARKLSDKVTAALGELGFPHPRFEVSVLPGKQIKSHGLDEIGFFFSPNPGHGLGPLQKIASSGEVARVLLAVKSVLAEVDQTPVLVFDEVDANVGGEVGRAVGRNLAGMGQRHQIFCITHLPQVAGLGHSHFLVEKSYAKDSTQVGIRNLDSDKEARLAELARMLGDRNAESAKRHAGELLQQAK
ncbi:MAG: DNA repair protein RecN [Opitutales bacterium]|nr:DNA repair protein RecN [Opitutales bacterium]